MKILKKADIIKLKQVDHVISENTILADIEHPFLVHYRIEIIASIGGIERFFTRCEIFVFLDGLYSWRRIVYILKNRGQVIFGALSVSFGWSDCGIDFMQRKCV